MIIKPAMSGCFLHVSREIKPTYLIDSSLNNSYDRTAIQAENYVHKLRNEAIENYMERTKQKIQVSPEKELWEAVIVLEERHNLTDVKKVSDYLEKNMVGDLYSWVYTKMKGIVMKKQEKLFTIIMRILFFSCFQKKVFTSLKNVTLIKKRCPLFKQKWQKF